MPSAHPSDESSTAINSSSKPFSISLSSKVKPISSSAPVANPRKRPRSSLAEESDSEGHERLGHAPQLVSAFDHSAGGAIGESNLKEPKAPLVIQRQSNRNWREEGRRKRGRNLLPAEERAAREGRIIDGDDTGSGERETFGLTIVKRNGDAETQTIQILEGGQLEGKAKTADEEALEALLEGKKKSNLVLPAIGSGDLGNERFEGRTNEEDSFKSDIASRPDSASMDDYNAVPIEEFGAALLRGMGWKEGDVVGKRKNQIIKARIVERRPALLGIGAKEVPDGLEELGAWGKGAKGKKMYTKGAAPVLLKNSVTGETLTEEEMKKKTGKQQKDEEDWRQRRDRNLAIDDGKKADKGYRDEGRSHGSSRHSSSRRDRSRSRDRDERRRDRQRGRDDYKEESRSSKHRHRDRADNKAHSSSRHRRQEVDDYQDSRSRKRTEVY
ncbi:hypothetical protein MMC26_006528 [Xylographa opegraphella]|nr:hypothetical protein [Xylographa opegraphella]